jgi:hypothetical protein
VSGGRDDDRPEEDVSEDDHSKNENPACHGRLPSIGGEGPKQSSNPRGRDANRLEARLCLTFDMVLPIFRVFRRRPVRASDENIVALAAARSATP